MDLATLPRLSAIGHELDLSSDTFGELQDSSAITHDFASLRARLNEEGYLFLRDYLHRDEVQEARSSICEALADEGTLDPAYPIEEAVIKAGASISFRADLAQNNPRLHKVLYDGPMMQFWRGVLGGPVRHFDYTWLRTVGPGHGTQPHCDIVYMGRGTQQLYTAWTPLGDISLAMGGLLLLENSHRHERLNNNYGRKDVDAFCENRKPNWKQMGGGGNIRSGGALSNNPVKLRANLGGRWLTGEYRMGDLLVFSVFTVHASLDNQTNRIRFSSDSRYQLASLPADERWIGPAPIAHGPQAKRGMIC
ncbi:MAG: hypothetical protein JWN98_275 [Abditibacteriota bacterium]|nr:hypothetical protein [Abditibacteriota bacterium]